MKYYYMAPGHGVWIALGFRVDAQRLTEFYYSWEHANGSFFYNECLSDYL